jgi:hypothetical protein
MMMVDQDHADHVRIVRDDNDEIEKMMMILHENVQYCIVV